MFEAQSGIYGNLHLESTASESQRTQNQ